MLARTGFGNDALRAETIRGRTTKESANTAREEIRGDDAAGLTDRVPAAEGLGNRKRL